MKPLVRSHSRLVLFGIVIPLLLITLTACFGGSSHTSTPVSTGSLVVRSEPRDGAEIFLDDKPTGETTPAKLENLEPGPHELTLVLDGLERSTQVLVVKGQTIPITIDFRSEIVQGYVVFGRGGPPVPNSIIEAIPEGSSTAVAETVSRRDGTFTLHFAPGRYHLIARQSNTWAVGTAQRVEVPTRETVEIIQQELFADAASADPKVLSLSVTGLEPGDVVSRPVQLIVDVNGANAPLAYYVALRVGHRDPFKPEAQVFNRETLLFQLDPANYGPGDTYVHVVAYDVQLNSAQLMIPFTIPPRADGGGVPLPAPTNVELASYTFLPSFRAFSLEQMDALADALAPYGVSRAEMSPEVVPPHHRWIRVAWDPVPGAAGYRVYRRAEGSDERVIVAHWSAPPEMVNGQPRHLFMDASAGLQTDTRYHYSVQAYDAAGELGPASDEVFVFLLEPFEAYLVEPADQAVVTTPPLLRWRGTRLPPLPGYTYDYIYHVGVLTELEGEHRILAAHNLEAIPAPGDFLIPGRSYYWDLTTAYATVNISGASRAFAISGRYRPGSTGPIPDWSLFANGGSMNGAFRFTMQPLP